MGRKTSTATPSRRRPLQRLLALFGLAALVGAPAAAQTDAEASRAALEARVALVREALQRQSGASNEVDGAPQDAGPQWANWPNWGNWNNWANWGNWKNR